MSAPFSENIIGSWLFTRSTDPFIPQIVHHFTVGGRCYWEMDEKEKRVLSSVRYRCDGSKLTVIYSDGTERVRELTVEDDGSVKVPSREGRFWWIVRLTAPEPYSIAFVDPHGQLEKLQKA